MELKNIFPVLGTAIEEGDLQKVIEMVSNNEEVLRMMTPFGTWLHYASSQGQYDIVKKLVELGIDVNTEGGTFAGNALNEAASGGYAEIVKFLLSCGAELDVSDSVKNPLFGAIYNGHLDIVKLLVENGIDYSVKYNGDIMKNRDAIEQARIYGQTEIVKYLESVIGKTSENMQPNQLTYDVSNMTMGDLKNEIKIAVNQHYNELINKNPQEAFYGYSLMTSEDVPHIFPVANKISSISADKTSEMYHYYKYCPDEWSDWDDFGMFVKVNQLIKKLYDEMEEEFLEYKEGVLNQALDALCELDSEGLFGVKDDNRFLIVWVSDSDNKIRKISAEKLNTSKVYNEFYSLL